MLVFKHKVERRDDSFSAIKYYKLRLFYSARVSKLTSRPTGLSVEQVGEESVEHGDERGAPSPSSEPANNSPSGDEQGDTPEPKVKILFELGTRHSLTRLRVLFPFSRQE